METPFTVQAMFSCSDALDYTYGVMLCSEIDFQSFSDSNLPSAQFVLKYGVVSDCDAARAETS